MIGFKLIAKKINKINVIYKNITITVYKHTQLTVCYNHNDKKQSSCTEPINNY